MKLKFGMVGGGNGAFIGDVHRHAALIDDLSELVCGCFSRNYEKNFEAAHNWGITDDSRIYKNYKEMAEKESLRDDKIDFVSVVTPNVSHFEIAKCFIEHGINVMCDKPLAMNVEQALELQRLSDKNNIQFGMSYGYTGYPAIRQGREMIRHGDIGDIIHVRVCHPEDWVIASLDELKSSNIPWRFNTDIIGESLCTGDLGTHAEQLLVQFTGLEIKKVLALLDRYPKSIGLETNSTVLMNLTNGVTGQLWASQLALGHECHPEIYVIGSKGSLEWKHETPDLLRYTKCDGITQILSAGRDYMYPESNRLTRVAAGHHEGFYEAFGNIYRAYCKHIIAEKSGDMSICEGYTYPNINDGVQGQKFIDACLKSDRQGNVWVNLD